jgi:hypothetical protein
MSSNAGPRSEDDFIRWCDTCDSPWRDCRTPKEHERKSKKIVKEKASRERQAQVLQKLEDLLENNSDMTPLKLQMPGNQKKSGLLYDKQQVIEAVLIKADMDTRMLASLLGQDEFDRYCDRVSRAIREHVAANDNEGPLARSLLASVSGAEVPCAHVSRGLNCDTTIAYRKVRHTRNYNANLAMEFGTATATTTPTPAAATTLPVRSTRPGSTPRRRNDSSLWADDESTVANDEQERHTTTNKSHTTNPSVVSLGCFPFPSKLEHQKSGRQKITFFFEPRFSASERKWSGKWAYLLILIFSPFGSTPLPSFTPTTTFGLVWFGLARLGVDIVLFFGWYPLSDCFLHLFSSPSFFRTFFIVFLTLLLFAFSSISRRRLYGHDYLLLRRFDFHVGQKQMIYMVWRAEVHMMMTMNDEGGKFWLKRWGEERRVLVNL